MLPTPLQLKEKLLDQSTPKKPVVEDESVIDNEISEMENSIQKVEKQLDEMTRNKRLQEKKDRLDQLKWRLEKSQKKLKAKEEEAESQMKDVTIDELRKKDKISKKAHKTLSSLGLVSESEQSSDDSDVPSKHRSSKKKK